MLSDHPLYAFFKIGRYMGLFTEWMNVDIQNHIDLQGRPISRQGLTARVIQIPQIPGRNLLCSAGRVN
jgi:hypothetical protein